MLASKADLEALLKLLKTKREEAKRVSWEVPYGGHRLTLSVSSFFSQRLIIRSTTTTNHPTPQDERKLGISLGELKQQIQKDIKKTEQRLRNAR